MAQLYARQPAAEVLREAARRHGVDVADVLDVLIVGGAEDAAAAFARQSKEARDRIVAAAAELWRRQSSGVAALRMRGQQEETGEGEAGRRKGRG